MYRTLPTILPNKSRGNGHYDQGVMGESPRESLSDLSHSYKGWGTIPENYYAAKLNSLNAHGNNDWRSNISVLNYFDDNSRHHWRAIRHAHIIKDNINKVPDLTQDEKDRMVAEAMCIKSFHYYNFFRNFGGVPWINRVLDPNSNLAIPRSTVEALVDSVCSTLDKAMVDLPMNIAKDDLNNDAGRWTKAGAMLLKAKLLQTAASPLFK